MALSYLADKDSKVPAKSRQGPHHDAPNWTTMSLGPALLTFSAKSESLSHWNTTIFNPGLLIGLKLIQIVSIVSYGFLKSEE